MIDAHTSIGEDEKTFFVFFLKKARGILKQLYESELLREGRRCTVDPVSLR